MGPCVVIPEVLWKVRGNNVLNAAESASGLIFCRGKDFFFCGYAKLLPDKRTVRLDDFGLSVDYKLSTHHDQRNWEKKKIRERIKPFGFPVWNIVHCVIVLMCLYIPSHSTDRAEACDLCLYNALPTNTSPALSISVQLKHPAYYGKRTMYCLTPPLVTLFYR